MIGGQSSRSLALVLWWVVCLGGGHDSSSSSASDLTQTDDPTPTSLARISDPNPTSLTQISDPTQTSLTLNKHQFQCKVITRKNLSLTNAIASRPTLNAMKSGNKKPVRCASDHLPSMCYGKDSELMDMTGLPCDCDIFPDNFDVNELPVWCLCLMCSCSFRLLPLGSYPLLGHTYYLQYHHQPQQRAPFHKHKYLCSLGSLNGEPEERGNDTYTHNNESVTLLQDATVDRFSSRLEPLFQFLSLPNSCLAMVAKHKLSIGQAECKGIGVIMVNLFRHGPVSSITKSCLEEMSALNNYARLGDQLHLLCQPSTCLIILHSPWPPSLNLCVTCLLYARRDPNRNSLGNSCVSCLLRAYVRTFSCRSRLNISCKVEYFVLVHASSGECQLCLVDLNETLSILPDNSLFFRYLNTVCIYIRSTSVYFSLTNIGVRNSKLDLISFGLESCTRLLYSELYNPDMMVNISKRRWYVFNLDSSDDKITTEKCLEGNKKMAQSKLDLGKVKIFDIWFGKFIFLECSVRNGINPIYIVDMLNCKKLHLVRAICSGEVFMSHYVHPSHVLWYVTTLPYRIWSKILTPASIPRSLQLKRAPAVIRGFENCATVKSLSHMLMFLQSAWDGRYKNSYQSYRCIILDVEKYNGTVTFFVKIEHPCILEREYTTNLTFGVFWAHGWNETDVGLGEWYKKESRWVTMTSPDSVCPALTPTHPDFQASLDIATGSIAASDEWCLKDLCSGRFVVKGLDSNGRARVGPFATTLDGGDCFRYLPVRFWRRLKMAHDQQLATINKFWTSDGLDDIILYPLDGSEPVLDWTYVVDKWHEFLLFLLPCLVTPAILVSNLLVLVILLNGGHDSEPQSLLRGSLAAADLLMGFPACISLWDHVSLMSGHLTLYQLDTDAVLANFTRQQLALPAPFRHFHLRRPGLPAFSSFLFMLSLTSSLLSLLALSFERYLRTSQPLSINRHVTLPRVTLAVASLWGVAFLFSTGVTLSREVGVRYSGFFDPISKLTLILPTGGDTTAASILLYMHVAFATLSWAVTTLHGVRAVWAWQTEVRKQRQDQQAWHMVVGLGEVWRKQDRRVTVILVVMAVATAAWLVPVVVVTALGQRAYLSQFHYLSWWSLMAASALNPLLYNLFSHRFRHYAATLLLPCCKRPTLSTLPNLHPSQQPT